PGNPLVLLSLVVYAALAAYTVMSVRKPDVIAFGFAYYLVTISIVSNLVILIGTVMAERLVYAPSLGICLGAAAMLARFFPSAAVETRPANMSDLVRANRKAFAAA